MNKTYEGRKGIYQRLHGYESGRKTFDPTDTEQLALGGRVCKGGKRPGL